jgi:hypothetical protein
VDVVDEEEEAPAACEGPEQSVNCRCDLLRGRVSFGEADRLRNDGGIVADQRLDATQRLVSGVLVVNSRGVANDLGKRPVRDAFAVLQTSPGQDLEVAADRGEELGRQSRLADTGLADDGGRDGAGGGPSEPLAEELELGFPTDHRRVEAASAGGRSGLDLREPVGGQRLGLALELERLDGLGGDGVADEPEGGLADQDLARRGGLLEAGGHVDGIPGDERLPAARVAGHDLAGVDADPKRDRGAVAALELLVQVLQALLHLPSGPNGAEGVVLMCEGDAEDGHDGIADELLHRAAVALDRATHPVEVREHQVPHRLRVHPLAQGRRARHVAEEERRELAALGRRSVGLEGSPAGIAEAGVQPILVPAPCTEGH